jgi:hypothetical protein
MIMFADLPNERARDLARGPASGRRGVGVWSCRWQDQHERDTRGNDLRRGASEGVQITLAEVFRHVETLDGDPWPTIRELVASEDRSLVPPVQAALERYLDEHEWYGRDLMVYILAGIRGTAVFPLLLRAFARPLQRDDRDNFCAWLADVMETDPAACRPTILSFIASGHRDLRSAGLWALGYVIQPSDVELLRQALADPDPRIRQDALVALSSLKSDRRA